MSRHEASGYASYAAYAALGALLRLLPLRAVRRLARATGRFVFACVPVRRGLTLENLRHAFPERTDAERARIAREAYVNLITTLFELVWTPRLDEARLAREIRVPASDGGECPLGDRAREAQDARAVFDGRGVVLLSAHYGNWEWAAQSCPMLLGRPCAVVVQPLRNRRVDRLVESYRSRFGNRTIAPGIAIREIVATLRGGGVVAMLGDQHGPAGGLYVPFLGRPAPTYEGPAALALRTGSRLVLALAERRADGSVLLRWEEIPTEDIAEPTEEHILELTRRHVRALERAVRERPGQWLWQHKRWKHAPGPGSRVMAE